MTVHTPGPWIWNGRHTIFTKDADCVAQFVNPADARLIAAAPELLEALIQVEAAGLLDRDWSLSSMVGAAIAKAKGEK